MSPLTPDASCPGSGQSVEYGAGEILARRHALQALEHGREGGGAFVAQIERDLRDGLVGGKARQGREQARLLPPCGEAQARLARGTGG